MRTGVSQVALYILEARWPNDLCARLRIELARDMVLQDFTLTVPLYTQVHKWVLANLMLRLTL